MIFCRNKTCVCDDTSEKNTILILLFLLFIVINMDKKFETLVDSAYVLINYNTTKLIFFVFRIEKFTMVGVDVKGVLVCDKSGLTLTSNLKYFFS